MVKLVRSQQGQFELGRNVMEWEDLMSQDTSIWENRVEDTLRAWAAEQLGPKPHVDGRVSHQREMDFKPKQEEQSGILVKKPIEEAGSSNIALSV